MMVKDLLEARIKAFNIKNIMQMILATMLILLVVSLNTAAIVFIAKNFDDKYYKVCALLTINIGYMIQASYKVIARLIAMLNIDYDKLVTPLDVIRSRRIKQIIKISIIMYIIFMIKANFMRLVKPEWIEDRAMFVIVGYILSDILLVKFIFAVHLMLEYNKLDFITALGRSWDILRGKKLFGILLLNLSLAPINYGGAILQGKFTEVFSKNMLLGLGMMFLIYFIRTYVMYLQTVYYYNYSKEDTSEFGPYR